ncbi:discoidin domain-containing protein [Paenibacillus soyae]|uniref:Discoidin domain-containing protein n=1 Tax=Paenibacillus soyae TaxID=2969249 RepID=A0A9X2MXD2_9BACL|nr:discoidin domain-containing protein [Paenibacillus soyae]MCR2807586.1 discoidin domain-containing protein [Paenibacillus soyae]
MNRRNKLGAKLAVMVLAWTMLVALIAPMAPVGAAAEETSADSAVNEPVAIAAMGTVYYVDDLAGDDANTGMSPEEAWQTLGKVNTVQFQPGDAILFKAGGSWSGMLSPQGSGSDGQPIVIDKYGEGEKPLIAGDGADAAIYFYNQEYWEVRNLEITNYAELPGQRRGIHVSGDSGNDWNNMREYKHFVFEYLDIHSVKGQQGGGWHSGGIIVWGPAWNYAVSDVVVRNNKIYSLDSVGVYLNGATRNFSSNNKIENNMIYDISADGAILLNTTNGIIQHNVVFDTHKRAGGYHVPLWTWGTQDALIQYNEVFNTYPGGDAMAYDSDYNSVGTIIQYNYSHNNAGGFVLAINDGTNAANYNKDTIIRYNISQNDKHTVFTIGGPVQNTLIHNNTVYLPEHSTTRVVGSGEWGGYAKDTYFYNNLLVNLGSGGYSFGQSTNNVFDSNLFYGNHPASVVAMDANAVTADPLLASPGSATIGRDTTDGYQLLQGSPAIGAGRVIPGNGGLDYWGNPVSAAASPNIGAYEGPGLDPANLPPLPPTPEEANLLVNAGFESGDFTGWGYHYNGAEITDADIRSGAYSAKLANAGSGMEQQVTGLQPNTMYILSGYGKGVGGGSAVLGVKNYGETFQDAHLNSSSYGYEDIVFRTGATNTSATVYLYKSGATGEVIFDDLSLIEYGEVPGSAPAVVIPPPVFTEGSSDAFNAGELDDQWNFIRENSAKWSLDDRPGYMTIGSEAGDIVDGQATARNILLTGAPEGDWTIDTRMVGKPTSQWSQGGLIVYESDQTYLRLTRLFGSGNQLQFTKQIDAARQHGEIPDPIASEVTYLRIVKEGNSYTGYYSADGITYTQVWTTQTADLAEPKIGLIVCAGTGLTASFDYFHITPADASNPPAVTGVSLDAAELSIHAGESAVLSATVEPIEAGNKSVAWSSSNAGVAQVDAGGKVTAVGEGAAVITVTTADGGLTDTVAVEVLPPKPGNIAPLAVASASSSHENGSFPPALAIDGVKNQDASRWISNTTLAGPHWLELTWDSYYEINQVNVYSGYRSLNDRQIADFAIQYWDGAAWQTAATVADNTRDGRYDQYNELTFPAVVTNKLRMWITAGSGYDNIARLFELEAFGVETEVEPVPVSGITVTGAGGATSLPVNGTLQLTAAALPANATDKTVTWSVTGTDGSATTLASIDQTGLLAAQGTTGTVKATAAANDGSGVYGELLVSIVPVPAEPDNIAPLATVTASSTHESFVKEHATDGMRTNASRWISASGLMEPQWLELGWSAPQEITGVKVYSGFLSYRGLHIEDFHIQYWDGSAWQTAASVADNTSDYFDGDFNDLTFPAVTTEKLRLYITKGSKNDNMARLFELEVWGMEAPPAHTPDTAPPVIEAPAKLAFSRTEPIEVRLAASDLDSGIQSLAVLFNGEPANNPIVFDALALPAGKYSVLVTATDGAGNAGDASFTLSVTAGIDELDDMIALGADRGWIEGRGVSIALSALAQTIQHARDDEKKLRLAVAAMEAAVKALRGKKLDESFADNLLADLQAIAASAISA